jgi:hypothetical protein
MDLQENIRRIQEVMGLITEQETNDCLNRYKPLIKGAVDWWKNWLNHPKTEEKWNKLYGGEKNYKDFLPSWITILNQIEIIPYDENTKELFGTNKQKMVLDIHEKKYAMAFVNKRCPSDIFVNCSINDSDDISTIIHEIQHLLENQYPINDLVTFAQKYSATTKTSLQDLASTEQQIIDKIGKDNTEDLKKNFGNVYIRVYNKAIGVLAHETDKSYVCNPKEKVSNLFAVRQLLNITPYEEITIPQVMPYLTGQKENTDVYWLFLCWVQLNFPPLQEYLNDLNSLAANTNKGNNTNV